MMRSLLILLALIVSGCNAPRRALPPAITWSKDIAFGAKLWREEAERKFPGQDPVVFVCHGTYDDDAATLDDMWVLAPDPPRQPMPVKALARTLRNLYPPRRPIILVVCNKRGHELSVPGVWFGRDRVWVIPDALDWRSLGKLDPEVGSIFEMEEGGPATRPTH